VSLAAAFRSVSNLLVTVAVGPGIVTHEYAHYLVCRFKGVDVVSRPKIRPLADDAVLEHGPVSTFGVDFPLAVAPFVCNSILAYVAFAVSQATNGAIGLTALWLGVTFGLTSLPSDADTATLFTTASALPRALRPLGFLLAAPVRAATWSVLVAGFLAFLWTVTLYTVSGTTAGISVW